MIFNVGIFEIIIPIWLMVVSGFIGAFLITFFGIPVIVRIAKEKKLMAIPNGRTSHIIPTPNLGGIAVFAGVVIASVLFSSLASSHELKYIIAGMLVLFFIGLKDDFIPIAPYKKILGQLAAAFIIIVPGDIRITSFHSLFGVDEIGYIISVLVTLSLFFALINSINLIDGINGLASGIGIICSVTFGIWFFLSEHASYAVFSAALIGSLVAFFWYNVFSKKNMIFLGDTGSMIIGILLAVFVVRFLEFENEEISWMAISSAPAVALSIVIIPLFDTARVFVIRIFNGKSPFTADRNHIHHRLLDLCGSHIKVTLIICLINVLFIVLALFLQYIPSELLISVIIVLATLLSFIPVYLKGLKNNDKTT